MCQPKAQEKEPSCDSTNKKNTVASCHTADPNALSQEEQMQHVKMLEEEVVVVVVVRNSAKKLDNPELGDLAKAAGDLGKTLIKVCMCKGESRGARAHPCHRPLGITRATNSPSSARRNSKSDSDVTRDSPIDEQPSAGNFFEKGQLAVTLYSKYTRALTFQPSH